MDDAAARPKRPRREQPPTSPDPVEIAMEAQASGRPVRGAAEQVLLEQVQLARAQRRNENLQAALRVLTGVAGLAAVIALGALAWNASQARGLVMEAFSVPPDLAARGLTGQVVASQVLDQLNDINDRTKSIARPIETMKNDWGGALTVEIPSTGISLDQVQRSLRGWLGHETHVRGEVFRTATGELALTVRAEGRSADMVAGPEADLGKLARQAAEALYGRTQPYRYGYYLAQNGRVRESYDLLTKLGDSGSPEDRPWALSSSVNWFPGPEAIRRTRRGLQLNPNLALGWQNIGFVQRRMGHAEEALISARQGSRVVHRRDAGGWRADQVDVIRHRFDAITAELSGDTSGALRETILADAEADTLSSAAQSTGKSRTARFLASNHDLKAAEGALLQGQTDVDLSRAGSSGSRALVYSRTFIARQREDWAGVFREAAGLEAYLLTPPASDRTEVDPMLPGYAENVATLVHPYMAEALAHLGRLAEAQALIATTPTDCYLCLRMRGEIAYLAGDAKEGARWFAEASRQGPSLPFADAEWGQALLARGETDAAVAHFAEAHRRSPHFPDALTFWGEALLRQGDAKAAAGKFEQAAAISPHWGRTQLLWGEALAKLGKPDEAGAKFAAATRLDLTPAERAELAKVQGAR